MPKIYVFVTTESPGWFHGKAIAEDGELLAGHVSSSSSWFHHDMGLTSEWKHDRYLSHHAGGFELVYVEGDPLAHPGCAAAIGANKELSKHLPL